MNNKIKNKFRDGGKCLCDICHNESKIGGFLTPQSADPMVVCCDCMMKISAKQQGISVNKAKKRREKMFRASNLFLEIKLNEFGKLAGKHYVENLNELNRITRYIMNVHNSFDKKTLEEFENLDDDELKKTYENIKMNFFYLLDKCKLGRNDLCHCGSNKKYKKCCLFQDEAKERLIAEWKKIDSAVIKKAMSIIDSSALLDKSSIIEFYWGEKRLKLAKEKGINQTDEFEFNEWLMNDFFLNEKEQPYILSELLKDNNLTNQERDIIGVKINAPMSVWLTTYIIKGEGVLIRNIFDQEEVFVCDKLFSETAQDGYLVCLRILNVGPYNLLSGGYQGYPLNFCEDIREIVLEEYKKHSKYKNINFFLRKNGYIFGRLKLELQEKYENK